MGKKAEVASLVACDTQGRRRRFKYQTQQHPVCHSIRWKLMARRMNTMM